MVALMYRIVNNHRQAGTQKGVLFAPNINITDKNKTVPRVGA